MEIIKGEFKSTGVNEVDVDFVVKKWNHLWVLSEYTTSNEFTLIKYVRKDSPLRGFRTTISIKQAIELQRRLDLKISESCFKTNSYRRVKDMNYLANWRKQKNIKSK